MPIPTDPEKQKYMFSDDMKFAQKIILYHPDHPNKFLALKSSPSHPTGGDQWDLPGGNVLYGENHMDSLLHEIQEETGVRARDVVPVEIVTRMEPEYYLLLIGYKGKAVSEKVNLSEEHTEHQWVTNEQFQQLETPQVFKDFAQKYA